LHINVVTESPRSWTSFRLWSWNWKNYKTSASAIFW